MGRFLYLGICNVGGVLLALFIGAILLIITTFTSLEIAAAIGVAIIIYVICFVIGIVLFFVDPFDLGSELN